MSAINAKTGAGAGVGATLGFLVGGPLGAGVGVLLGGIVAHQMTKPKAEMTPRRALIYTRAMESIKTPADLNQLADSFASEGLHVQANMLRKRAALRNLPPAIAAQRRLIFRKAMCSDNAQAIRNVGSQFAEQGSTDAAKMLFAHATAVEVAHAAGGTMRPVEMKMLEAFADKLARAIGHFGPESKQALSASANLIRAQGKLATKEAVLELIEIAKPAMAEVAAEAEATAAKVEAETQAAVEAAAEPDVETEKPAAKAEVEEPTAKVRVASESMSEESAPVETIQARSAEAN
jgi:hypothetical protein